jgi:hypothetical protein
MQKDKWGKGNVNSDAVFLLIIRKLNSCWSNSIEYPVYVVILGFA